MQKISIIVPIYNVERYLPRCIDSILAQCYPDFELILIDDGSPDKCGSICEEYASKDSRIVVLHQKNRGASYARNAGLDIAQGTYVTFCDSDDMVSPKWLEHLLLSTAPDVLPICSYCNSHSDLGAPKALAGINTEVFSIRDYFLFNQRGIAGFLCNALYRNEVIQANHLRLRTQQEKGDYNEDLLFALQYVRHMKHIVYTGYSDYLYDTHPGSLSTSYKNHYFDKYVEKYQLWRSFLEEFSQMEQIADLSTTMLYHFLSALNHESMDGFRKIVHSDIVQACVRVADTSAENPAIIRLIRNKAVFSLWLRYKLHALKGRLK